MMDPDDDTPGGNKNQKPAWTASLDAFVKKQKPGAQFVVTAQMLRMPPKEFDALANAWLDDGGPGFNVVGVPHRVVVEGEFFIGRVTVIRTTAQW